MSIRKIRTHLRRAAVDAARLLAEFDTPPAFRLWDNPVLSAARKYPSLFPKGHQSLMGDVVFNGSLLVDDGHQLQDAGINAHRRLWMIYRFDSLTDTNGDANYTIITTLLSITQQDDKTIDLLYGFDWQGTETLCRLILDAPENKLVDNVFSKQKWTALHSIAVPNSQDHKGLDA